MVPESVDESDGSAAHRRTRSGPKMNAKLAAEELKAIRREVLQNPRLLTGVSEPAIESIWAYCHGIGHCLDVVLGRTPGEWFYFLNQVKRFGSRTDLGWVRDRVKDYSEQLKFLLELYTEYDAWYEKHYPSQDSEKT